MLHNTLNIGLHTGENALTSMAGPCDTYAALEPQMCKHCYSSVELATISDNKRQYDGESIKIKVCFKDWFQNPV